MTGYKPKLIEVALPLAAINKEAAREKSIRHGHPSTLHLWWARRPLAAARAVIWASLVDDPSSDESLSPEEQEAERQRLFRILERLVKWKNSNNSYVLAEARAEIDRCFPDGPPPILDPFAGGGAIPLEAQRLGLKALSGDLNPVAVLIQRAMLEIPPRFAGLPPVHPDIDHGLAIWSGTHGLAADVEAYGEWMRNEAKRRIGHLYPDVMNPAGKKLMPIAWIWARTVESPDPAWHGHVPLVNSWVIRNKKGKPRVWIEPIVDRDTQTIGYKIREGGEPSHKPSVRRGKGTCIATGTGISSQYIKSEGQVGRLREHLVAIVAEGDPRGRVYCEVAETDFRLGLTDFRGWKPDQQLPPKGRGLGFRVQPFGFDEWWKLFTPRQLQTLSVFSELLEELRATVITDALKAGLDTTDLRLHEGGLGATAYSDAVATFLAFAIDRCAARWTHLAVWNSVGEKLEHLFRLNALQMNWVYSEGNPFSNSSGNWRGQVKWVTNCITWLSRKKTAIPGRVRQGDAIDTVRNSKRAVISTDPPYYDNIGYADLSDFFYVWLRRSLIDIWPRECATLLTPKSDEIIADPGRHGGSSEANAHFEERMERFMRHVSTVQIVEVPATLYYAYKATEDKQGEVRSTGWDTFLQAVVDAGLQVTATWPLRTEMPGGTRMVGRSALSTSVVLACRPRPDSAPLSTRGQFMSALRDELPAAVKVLQSGNIAPVDLPQSTIGPGIRVFSRFARVIEADGSSMPVSDALAIINDVLGEILDGEDAELDPVTRFAAIWYSQHAFESGHSGDADNQARAKNTSLSGIEAAGVGQARAGEFRLYRRDELDPDWSALDDNRLTVWKATQQLVAALNRSEQEAARLLHQLGAYGNRARQLGYLLFSKATEARNADEAAAYNGLINAWPILRSMTPDRQQQLL